ncbi:MAG: pre-peptidase C-terminal domain-containing protein [Holophagales bacterium]|nr:pre-peptidase C-terminal domain-containing protein [Holophagales bacterium]
MKVTSNVAARKLCLAAAGLLLASTAGAQVALQRGGDLHPLSFESSRLTVVSDPTPIDEARASLGLEADLAFQAFAQTAGGSWIGYVDQRTGVLEYVEGSGLAWVAGAGNQLATEAAAIGAAAPEASLARLDAKARDLARSAAPMLGIDAANLVLDESRSSHPASHVWFVEYGYRLDGVPVEGARVVFSVNNGNLVSIGSENLPAPGTRLPKTRFASALARKVVEDYVGGFLPDDVWVDTGSYHLLPASRLDARYDAGYEPGAGRDVAAVWQFVFRRVDQVGTFRARVDATSGELLDFLDVNDYGSVTGGTYQGDRPAPEVVLPMPFANVATGVYTNSAGIFSGTTGTTTLTGQYVRIVDSCGSISKSADGSGAIAMGSSSGTDCTTPGSGGSGNTHAARTQYYALNRVKEVARGWLPSNSWLSAQLRANVNLNQTCNAYWNGSTVNFFRSGGGCANTGELPGVSLHEWGHGLDTNDGSGSSPDNGTGETYGDFTAALATHASCIGNGFLGSSNCGGYGNSCTSCSGVRDIDYAKHSRNTPSTVANFTQTTCPQPSANNPNYVGPCGKDAIARSQTTKKREGHCESYVSSEALWDLAARDMPGPGSGSAWAIVDRLWYLSRSTASAAFTCNVSGTTWTSSGCATGSLFRIFRTVDDDNGNLADGTPHGGAIAAAMNRHGIACTTDAGWNTTFAAVTPPAAPSLTATAGNNSASLSWSGSSGVYDVYRNETGCNAGFTKVANDLSGSSYNDTAVANGITYYYQVVAQPSGNEAAASSPSTCRTVTPTGGGTCTPPAAPTGVSANATSQTAASVSWSASSGATSYAVFRSTTSGSGYSQVGTSTSTSFSDSGLSCNTTYYYVIQASNGSCSSGNSSQASTTTQACSGGGSVLANGVPVTGISGAAASLQYWTMEVPAGATNLSFQLSGGSGDADMYVKFGSAPTTSSYDCRPYLNGNNESCTFATPSAGTWHVMLRGYSAYSGASLVGSFTETPTCTPPSAPTGVSASGSSQTAASVSWSASSGATSYIVSRSSTSGGPYSQVGTTSGTSFSDSGLTCNTSYYYVVKASNGTCESGNSSQASATTQACSSGGGVLANGVPETNVSGATGSQQFWTMDVPSGATNLSFQISGGTGDADLYVRFGSAPTTSTYDCRPYQSGNNETCTFAAPSAGTWHVMLNGYSAYSGVTLVGSFDPPGGGGGCTTSTLYSHSFESGSGLSNWSKGSFLSGGSTTSWRGIQTCTAHGGSKIFRYGGSSCTGNYGNGDFNFAKPNGASGITVPAGSSDTTLSFWHRRRFESGYDGATLAVSVDGSNYVWVPASAITGSAYNGTIAASCAPSGAAGTAVWTGNSTSFTQITVDLDAACNAATGGSGGCAGQTVHLAFTTITDCSTTDDGWFLDDISVTACTP